MKKLYSTASLLLASLLVLPAFAKENAPVQVSASADPSPLADKIDWPAFLARQDLVYGKLPESWLSGAFTGNGQLGAMAWSRDKGKTLTWRVGRSDVYFNVKRAEFSGRIPIGDLTLEPVGAAKGAALRMGLWDAETTGTLTTDKGTLAVRSYTHADRMVQVFELAPSEGENGCRLVWRPSEAVNPRLKIKRMNVPKDEKNPAPVAGMDGDIHLSLQAYCTGGGHVVAWSESASSGPRLLLLSVGYSTRDIGEAQREAVAAVRQARDVGMQALRDEHRAWWHKFWPASFISFPDPKLEKFYWMQIYKMASGTRADRPALDLMGPWFDSSPWCKIWWNLNIQLTYWAQLGSNRLELGESLCKMLDRGTANLARNAGEFAADSASIGCVSGHDCVGPCPPSGPGARQICNLPWALHNYYLQYRYSMDDAMLRDRLFPLLKRSCNFYLHLLEKGEDGKLHLTTGWSPEYERQPASNPDCNIDLALLRWNCGVLLDACARLKIDDPQIPQWKETLANLTPYPADQNGLRISASVPFSASHRHFSHLVMVYPLYIMNLDQPENRDLILKSLRHWMSMPKALAGYSFTGASSMSSYLGNGDAALGYLHKLLAWRNIGPNTMYREAGPCIETPLAAAASVHDMLLSSWGDKIRVFPAIPAAWKDVTIHNMRTEGAFLVSAVRRDGRTRFVRITSLAGEPCRVMTDMPDPQADRAVPLKPLGGGTVELTLKKGESVVLHPAGENPVIEIAPLGEKRSFDGKIP